MKKYIFVHVPKCGGTTIRETMSPHAVNPLHLFPESKIDLMSLEEILSHDMIFSHCPITHFASKLGNRIHDYKILTSLRNPLDRYVSEFFQWQRAGQLKSWGEYINTPLNTNSIAYFFFGDRIDRDLKECVANMPIKFNHVFDVGNLSSELPEFMQSEGYRNYTMKVGNRVGFDWMLSREDYLRIMETNKLDVGIWNLFRSGMFPIAE